MASERLLEVPKLYRIFFLTIEPISALVGAFYAYFLPSTYLSLTAHAHLDAHRFSPPVATSIEVVLAQLANLYLLFAINEALVLRSALEPGAGARLSRRGQRVWNAVLFGLLVADLGHLWSVRALGAHVYWEVSKWNAMDAGNVGFVYAGAAMRICWLMGIGKGRRGIQ